MPKRSIEVTREAMENLAEKLDTFGAGLPEEERALLTAVVAAGTQSLVSEVQGYGQGISLGSFSLGLMSPGTPIKQIQEVTGLKMEQDVIEYKSNTPDGKYM